MPFKHETATTLEEAVLQLIEQNGGTRHTDLIRGLIATALQLMDDETSRGDLKILNATLKELRYAFKVFAPYRHVRKVSVFGSARTGQGTPECAQARGFAQRMVEEGFMVITGAGPGVMEAANAGAGAEKSFGVGILLPFGEPINSVVRNDPKLIEFKYFFTRKLLFVKETDAFVFLPGGFGTQDEAFEVLTLLQTGKSEPIPLVFLDAPGGFYWREWLSYVEHHLLRRNLISQEDFHLFKVTDDVEKAVEEICAFYRRYHSMRFVRDRLVLRLSNPLPSGRLKALSEEFADILTRGAIEESGPLGEEMNEPEIAHLGRLVLHFDREHYGRLRLLIDRINSP